MDRSEFKFRGCVGKMRTGLGTWYVPNGQKASECTYCEWCLRNGCFKKEDTYSATDLMGCNCDCTQEHDKMKEFVCDDHKFNVISDEYFDCNKCKRACLMRHGDNIAAGVIATKLKYCRLCSTFFGMCIFCDRIDPAM